MSNIKMKLNHNRINTLYEDMYYLVSTHFIAINKNIQLELKL